MRIALRTLLVMAIAMAGLQRLGAADDKPAFKDDKEKASYAVGIFVGNQIKRSNMEVDLDVLLSAVNDVLAGKELRPIGKQAVRAIRTYQQEARKKLAEKNKKEGEAFLAQN